MAVNIARMSFEKKIEYGMRLANLKMLREKALHNLDVAVCNDEGDPVLVPAKDLIAAQEASLKEYETDYDPQAQPANN